MPQPYIVFDTKTAKGRVLSVALLLGVVVLCWYGVRWQLGNMLAELTRPGDPGAKRVSEVAVGLAPGDPLAQWLAASTHKMTSPGEQGVSTVMFEDVVRLSPYDYRWRIELDRKSTR